MTLSPTAQEATPPVEPTSATPAPIDLPTPTGEPPTITPLPSDTPTSTSLPTVATASEI